MANQQPTRRWYHPTPDRFFVALLAAQALLLLSERFEWFAFNEKKGWAVLIAVGVVGIAVVVMLIWGLVCLFLRRRFQFSFRSLLVFLVAVSVPLGWFAREMQRAKRQQEAVEMVLKARGGFRYDYERDETWALIPGAQPPAPVWLRKSLGDDFFCEVAGVNVLDTQVTDAGLEHLRGLTSLEELNLRFTQVTDAGLEHLKGLNSLNELDLSDTQVTDAGLKHLKGLNSLEVLHIHDTQVTDVGLEHFKGLTSLKKLDLNDTQVIGAGLEHLKGLTSLEWLNLHDTQVTDAGLKHLKGLDSLEWLGLDGTQVTDVGLEHLKELTRLESLGLNGTQVTDAGLEHLKGLTSLERLGLHETQVTDQGVKKFRQALPNCWIFRGNRTPSTGRVAPESRNIPRAVPVLLLCRTL